MEGILTVAVSAGCGPQVAVGAYLEAKIPLSRRYKQKWSWSARYPIEGTWSVLGVADKRTVSRSRLCSSRRQHSIQYDIETR